MSKEELYDALMPKLGRDVAYRAAELFDPEFFKEQSWAMDDTPRQLLVSAFEWESTEEGYDYWHEKYQTL